MHVCLTCMQDLFIQSLQSVGLYTENLQELLEVLNRKYTIIENGLLDAYAFG